MTRVDVVVTEDDIREGWRGDPTCCPIARALKRGLPNDLSPDRIAVLPHRAAIDLTPPRPDLRAELPAEAVSFIRAFDHYQPVAPFAFTLEFEEVKYPNNVT